MTINILTLFPAFFSGFLDNSIIKRALAKGTVSFKVCNIRDFSLDKNHRVDDHSIGGGAGLVMRLEPLLECLDKNELNDTHKILLTPKGQPFKQQDALRLSQGGDITLICGHYEGIDTRFEDYVDEQISIGDYIMTGGEIGAMAIADAITRLLPGTIAQESIAEESFTDGLLEYPQYTYPVDYQGKKVPDILFTGDHEKVRLWRLEQALKLTLEKRPDLLTDRQFSKEELKILAKLKNKSGA